MSTLSFSAQDAIAKDDTLYDSFVCPSVCLLHCGIAARNCVNKLLRRAVDSFINHEMKKYKIRRSRSFKLMLLHFRGRYVELDEDISIGLLSLSPAGRQPRRDV